MIHNSGGVENVAARKTTKRPEDNPAREIPVDAPITDAIEVPVGAKTIEDLQREEHDRLVKIRDDRDAARRANAVSHSAGGTSPVQLRPEARNECPKCGNLFLAVYRDLKVCNACGWRSDAHVMEPYE